MNDFIEFFIWKDIIMKITTGLFLLLLTLLSIQQTQIVKLNSQLNEVNNSLNNYATVKMVREVSYYLHSRADRIAYQLIDTQDFVDAVHDIETTKYDWAIGLTTDQISYIYDSYDPEDFLMMAEKLKNDSN